MKNKQINTAMILAAGLGTRLKPWTDQHPKALALVNGKSLLQRNIEYLQGFGIDNVIVNVHHFSDQIISSIKLNNGWGSEITISDESDEVLETGGGLLKAQNLLSNSENFVLMNCDILTNLNIASLCDFHLENNAIATLAVSSRETSRYLLFNSKNELIGWKNTKTGEEKLPAVNNIDSINAYAFSGIHVINKSIFNKINFTGKFSMIDLYLDLCKNHKILAFNHSNDILIDVGKPEAIQKAEQMFI